MKLLDNILQAFRSANVEPLDTLDGLSGSERWHIDLEIGPNPVNAGYYSLFVATYSIIDVTGRFNKGEPTEPRQTDGHSAKDAEVNAIYQAELIIQQAVHKEGLVVRKVVWR